MQLLKIIFVSVFLLTAVWTGAVAWAASISTLGAPVTENFDTLASSGLSSSVTPDWAFSETGINANTFYTAGTGSNNAGDTYSYGASLSTERAFGMLRSGSLVPTIGAMFTNNTGATIGVLNIVYTGEMWRAGVTNRGAADRLDFQLSTNANSLTTGTWVDYDNLDFNSPNINTTAGALDGNSAANKTSISFTTTGLSIPNGSSFWIRWTDFDISSSDDGLAVDDFSLTANTTATPVPEPSTMLLLGSSLIGLAGYGRRKLFKK